MAIGLLLPQSWNASQLMSLLPNTIMRIMKLRGELLALELEIGAAKPAHPHLSIGGSMTTPIDVLRTADLFAGLDIEQIQALADLGEKRTFQRGDIIVREEEAGDEFFIVLSGQVKVGCLGAADGPTLVLLGAGQGFGEISMLDSGPRSATISCVSESAEVLIIHGKLLLDYCDREHLIGYRIMYNLARDLAFKLRHRNISLQQREECES